MRWRTVSAHCHGNGDKRVKHITPGWLCGQGRDTNPRAGSRGHNLAGGTGQGAGEGSWAQILLPSEEVPMETCIPLGFGGDGAHSL